MPFYLTFQFFPNYITTVFARFYYCGWFKIAVNQKWYIIINDQMTSFHIFRLNLMLYCMLSVCHTTPTQKLLCLHVFRQAGPPQRLQKGK